MDCSGSLYMFMFLAPTPARGHARVDILGGGGGWGGGGGVGWDVNAHCDCNHIIRSLALPHICHATLHVLLHFHTYVVPRCTFSCTSFHAYVMPRCCTFFCTSTHTSLSCCAAPCSLGLPHIRHATSQTACYADGCKAWKGA